MNFTITETQINKFIKKKEESEGEFDKYLNLNKLYIFKMSLKKVSISNIEHLSLKHNSLNNLDFVKSLPNLWSLDIRDNNIQNFIGISDRCFGHLAVTLEKNSFVHFFQLKKISICILIVEGAQYLYEKNEKYWNLLYNSQSDILKFNDEVVMFNNEKNFDYFKSDTLNCLNPSCLVSKNINYEELSNIPIFNNLIIRGTSMKSNLLLHFFSEFKSLIKDVVSNYLYSIFQKNLSENKQEGSNNAPIKINNMEKFGRRRQSINKIHIAFDIKETDFNALPEYSVLEKNKIIVIYKVFNSLKEKHELDFDFELLKVNDTLTLIMTLNVLLLYIFCIVNKVLASGILKLLFKKYFNENFTHRHLRAIFDAEIIYLIGFYFDLLNHLISINKADEHRDSIKLLEINELVLNANLIAKKHLEYKQIYDNAEEYSMALRKLLINCHLIKFIEDKLKIFPCLLKNLQHLYDFILIKKFDKYLTHKFSHFYRIFLEIHCYLFEKFETSNSSNKEMQFNGYTFREYNKNKIKKICNDFYFMTLYKNKKVVKTEICEPVHERKKENLLNNNYGKINSSKISLEFKVPLEKRGKNLSQPNIFSSQLSRCDIKSPAKIINIKLKPITTEKKDYRRGLKSIDLNDNINIPHTAEKPKINELFKNRTKYNFLNKTKNGVNNKVDFSQNYKLINYSNNFHFSPILTLKLDFSPLPNTNRKSKIF